MKKEFFVSVIIPTYNNERTLQRCLSSVYIQDYKDFEVICVDGGSTDKTLDIIKDFDIIFLNNPHKIEEKAKPLALKKAKGELILLIDSDNVLPHKSWLSNMVLCFNDHEIVGADTYYYGYLKKDNIFTRYAALIGGDDPIASYLGINDRYCYFTNKWTGFPAITQDTGLYYKVTLTDAKRVPAMGSNGFMVRKKALDKISVDPYVHTVVIYDLVNNGENKFAKTKDYIIHIQDGFSSFIKKKIRRIKRRKTNEVTWRYSFDIPKINIILLGIYIITLILLLKDTFVGFFRKRTYAWVLHPIMCVILLFVYLFYSIKKN